MIFVDTNVIMYAVGREHPLQEPAQAFFSSQIERPEGLVCSAEVLQELMHAYLPVHRHAALEAAFTLVEAAIPTIWPIEPDDVHHARVLADTYPGLGARELLHLSCCQRRGVQRIETFDRGLRSAFP